MLKISQNVEIPEEEIEFSAIRAQGAGGQNVNKVSSAIHLRFDIKASSLPDFYKNRLLTISDQRINKNGIIIIKAQRFRTQEKNKADALKRLKEFIKEGVIIQKTRKPTRATKSSQKKRLDSKTRRSRTKNLRSRVIDE